MADLQKQFLEFHDAIKLGTYEENGFLREKRNTIIDKLKSKLAERKDDGYPQYERSFNQGSYALNTGIQPVRDGDYDIDVGVLLDCHKEDYKPIELKELVADCIKHNNRTVEVSRSCVTVTYMKNGKPDYHVDLPIYAKSSNAYDDTYYLAKGRKGLAEDKRVWQSADPEGINLIINGLYKGNDTYENNGSDQRKQFRRCVRYLKRWRNHKCVGIHSIGLTIAAYHWLEPDVDTQNDGEVLLDLIKTILSNFDYFGRLSINLPITPSSDLLKSVSDEDMATIKERFEALRDNLQSAVDEPDTHEASKTLRKSFGDDFPIAAKVDKAKKSIEAPYVSTGSSA
ncbi:nucleotidyltransferase [Psychrobacter sp. SZ93C1]|uniref:nucleotidyltransferase domain-containing protein n=1 Tax=Psychrobacter sp. SZ93C1 TaxID=2792058 RepID=UPI0018CDFA68|nr:nucleotidyltransferase [Psychrobacter sp. SZ93C1]MBH0064236.1 nucleotidyltransferase [Psychrobacter sp. SZ93C1]